MNFMGKKERLFITSEEAIVRLSNVIMILLFYLKWKNLEVFGKVNCYRNKGLSLPIGHNQS